MKKVILFATVFSTIFFLTDSAAAQIAAGGAFALQQTVVAGGGEKSAGGAFAVENTGGQPVAGQTAANGAFSVTAGFWTPTAFAPTAAHVTLGGRVLTSSGAGIRNAVITLTNSSGETRTTVAGSFGYFRFAEVEAGATYLVSVASKRFVFGNAVQIVSVSEARDDLEFIADPQ